MPYVRLNLDQESAALVGRLAAAGERAVRDAHAHAHGGAAAAPGAVMFSQLRPEAGLGCHPFHATLVGALHSASPTDVQDTLRRVTESGQFPEVIEGRAMGWVVHGGARAGRVMIALDAPAVVEAGRVLALDPVLGGGNLW
jgi:hypothetical protein